MRTTQYIGLTKRAETFVASLHSGNGVYPANRFFEGTCGEKIKLKDWISKDKSVFPKNSVVREVVQAIPWSCGAMVFTCLEVEYPNGERVQFNQWVPCPMVKERQYDKDSGTYWV